MFIETVKLQARDLRLLAPFYSEQLGLPTHLTDRLTIAAGATQLIFEQAAGFTGRYHFAFNIPENRLDACRAALEARPKSRLHCPAFFRRRPQVADATFIDVK